PAKGGVTFVSPDACDEGEPPAGCETSRRVPSPFWGCAGASTPRAESTTSASVLFVGWRSSRGAESIAPASGLPVDRRSAVPASVLWKNERTAAPASVLPAAEPAGLGSSVRGNLPMPLMVLSLEASLPRLALRASMYVSVAAVDESSPCGTAAAPASP